MADPRVHRFKSLVASINEVLYREWSPIGFAEAVPADEYEAYAVRVVAMLTSGSTDNELAGYLARAAAEMTGNPYSVELMEPVVQKIVVFREAARDMARS